MFSVVAAELLYFGITFTPVVDKHYLFPTTATTDFLQRDKGLYRILPVRDLNTDFHIMPPNTNMPYKIQSVIGYDSLYIRRYAEFMTMIETGTTGWLDQPCAPKFENIPWLTRYDSKLLDMLNVKYLLVKPSNEIQSRKFRKVFAGELSVYENQQAFPRAFVIFNARVVTSKRALLTTLLSPQFDPSREVILEESPLQKSIVDNPKAQGSAEVVAYSPRRITIHAHLPQDGFVVLGDSYYPGWKVFADGNEVSIYRANYILRAVFLKQGKHHVEFVYEPLSFAIGKWVSFSTLLIVLGSFALSGYFSKPPEKDTPSG